MKCVLRQVRAALGRRLVVARSAELRVLIRQPLVELERLHVLRRGLDDLVVLPARVRLLERHDRQARHVVRQPLVVDPAVLLDLALRGTSAPSRRPALSAGTPLRTSAAAISAVRPGSPPRGLAEKLPSSFCEVFRNATALSTTAFRSASECAAPACDRECRKCNGRCGSDLQPVATGEHGRLLVVEADCPDVANRVPERIHAAIGSVSARGNRGNGQSVTRGGRGVVTPSARGLSKLPSTSR